MATRPKSNRRNAALKFFVNGKRAQQLEGLADLAGNALSAYDVAVTRSVVGLKRRTLPAVSRGVREFYSIKAGTLREKYRVETGTQGRRRDQDDFISIWASVRPISLLEFQGRWRGRKSPGAVASIERGQAKTYDGAFISTVEGLRAIRVRSFNSAAGRRHGRGPLRMLRGPSPFDMLSGASVGGRASASVKVRDQVITEMTDFYTTELRRQWQLARGRS